MRPERLVQLHEVLVCMGHFAQDRLLHDLVEGGRVGGLRRLEKSQCDILEKLANNVHSRYARPANVTEALRMRRHKMVSLLR